MTLLFLLKDLIRDLQWEIMKKFFSILISVAFISLLFWGCESKGSEPLRICFDLEKGYVEYVGALEPAVKGFLETVADLGGPEDGEAEYIPASGSERKSVLTQLRNEIMAGSGPDVFIVISGNDRSNLEDDDPLFPFPEKSMASGLFLPLDSYIENAQFLEWDKLTPQVMAAGKIEKGQMLLPLCYTFPVTFYRKEEVSLMTTAETTWEDMINDSTGLLSCAGNMWYQPMDGYTLITPWNLFPAALLGKGEDYEAEQLNFTQEELLTYTKQAVSLYQREQAGEFDSLPSHKPAAMTVDECSGIEYAMVPCYQVHGGVTATVTAFAGINANTKRADDAFFLLDVLLKGDFQEKSSLYQYFGDSNGIPTYEGLMTEEHPASGGWHMSDSNYQEFSRIREQITATRFSSILDTELTNMLSLCCGTDEDQLTETEIEEIVSETYRKLKLYLSES